MQVGLTQVAFSPQSRTLFFNLQLPHKQRDTNTKNLGTDNQIVIKYYNYLIISNGCFESRL